MMGNRDLMGDGGGDGNGGYGPEYGALRGRGGVGGREGGGGGGGGATVPHATLNSFR